VEEGLPAYYWIAAVVIFSVILILREFKETK